jgi:hypothetical protein
MDVRPRLGLVMTSRQLLLAQVAVALCSGVATQTLAGWEDYRVRMGAAYDSLARRFEAARKLDESAAVRLIDLVDGDGQPVLAVEVELSGTEVRVLRVAIDRLRGILARTGEFDGALDEDLDDVAAALI